jgi:RND family efflux transporter MFP subunit
MLVITKPVAEQRIPPEPVIEVETATLRPRSFTIVLDSQGTVSARTESSLIPQVSGEITRISDNFRDGGFFTEGESLMEVDSRDYRTSLTVAEANLAAVRVRLAEEEAQTSQAQEDWARLGEGEAPTDLVLRVPQLALARANVKAAEARLAEAKRDLQRTRITAPYDGRVLRKNVDVGQVVSPGAVLAEVYAVDYAEIRLPLTTAEYAFLDIQPVVRGEAAVSIDLPVTLSTEFAQDTINWQGRIVRVEGAIDTRSRQLFVVAQVDDPYGPGHEQPLKVGLFVEARIEGSVLEDVYVLPRTSFREASYILTLDAENRIRRVEVNPVWMDSEVIVFRHSELRPGTLITITPIPLAIDGMRVQPIDGEGGGSRSNGGKGKRPRDGKRPGNRKQASPAP